jgi:hypothetical protein
MWESAEPDAAETGWAQRFFSAMEPYSTGGIYGTGAGDESRTREGRKLERKADPRPGGLGLLQCEWSLPRQYRARQSFSNNPTAGCDGLSDSRLSYRAP